VVISFDFFAQEPWSLWNSIDVKYGISCCETFLSTHFWPSLCFRVQDSNYRQYELNITYMQSLGFSIQDNSGGKINILEGHCEKKVHMNII
jgi:hypothetical protein